MEAMVYVNEKYVCVVFDFVYSHTFIATTIALSLVVQIKKFDFILDVSTPCNTV